MMCGWAYKAEAAHVLTYGMLETVSGLQLMCFSLGTLCAESRDFLSYSIKLRFRTSTCIEDQIRQSHLHVFLFALVSKKT